MELSCCRRPEGWWFESRSVLITYDVQLKLDPGDQIWSVVLTESWIQLVGHEVIKVHRRQHGTDPAPPLTCRTSLMPLKSRISGSNLEDLRSDSGGSLAVSCDEEEAAGYLVRQQRPLFPPTMRVCSSTRAWMSSATFSKQSQARCRNT